MRCTRLDHFVRFNPNGTVSRCGHMTNAPQFESLDHMERSEWLQDTKKKFEADIWPNECVRCRDTESINGSSIRLNSLQEHESRPFDDYLQVAGVLDNVCNSACQFCDETLSTKIGSLRSKTYPLVNNFDQYHRIPQHRIVWLDINGGEPSASPGYRRLLDNLPVNLRYLRVNTNAALVLPQLERINRSGVEVTVTISFDGLGPVHDYNRWPIRWETFERNIGIYQTYDLHDLNFWTTVNALNVNDFENILAYVQTHELNHSWALLDTPNELNVKYTNRLTLLARDRLAVSSDPQLRRLSELVASERNNQEEIDRYIHAADQLRGICIDDYLTEHALK